jgi:hypothetical protein
MPSADFCAAVRPPYDDLSPESGTQRRPPEVRSIAFTARPPNLPPRSLMTVDFAISCSLVRTGRPRYPVFVHRAAALLHASFRPHLAMTPLRFANPSPPSGWIEDFHSQAVDHARHTTKREGPEKTLPHVVWRFFFAQARSVNPFPRDDQIRSTPSVYRSWPGASTQPTKSESAPTIAAARSLQSTSLI